MTLPTINAKALQAITHRMMILDMRYGLGSKIPLATPVEKCRGKRIDCSGMVRYLVYHSTDERLVIPDGSFNQKDWIAARATRVSYEEAGRNPSDLFIAFISPTAAHRIGHVWFLRGGWTYESHGGVGPNSRHWNTNILKNEVSACYHWKHSWL
jgi:hypothetical protein